MRAILRTRCGCSREIEVTRQPVIRIYRVRLSPKVKITKPGEEPKLEYRDFEFVGHIEHDGQQVAVYEEA